MATLINGNQISSSTVALMNTLTLSNRLVLPNLPTTSRPSSPTFGTMVFDTTLDNVIVFCSNSDGIGTDGWKVVGAGGPSRGRDAVIRTNRNYIDETLTIGASQGEQYVNGFSAGPITINTGSQVTVETGANWYILGGSEESYPLASFSGLQITGMSDFQGMAQFRTMIESSVWKAGASGTQTCSLNDGAVFYFYRPSATTFTVNLTNVPTTPDRAISVAFIVDQGFTSTTYGIPNTFQIQGTTYSVRWLNNVSPSGSLSTTQRFDVVTITILNLGGGNGYKLIGQYSTFGS